MRSWILLGWLVLCPALGWAADLTANDFAFGMRIDVPQGTAVAALNLPETVYTTACRTDLGDIRVFNGQGEPVPHLLRVSHAQEIDVPWQSLPFFPVPETVTASAGGYRVHVRTGPDGAVVDIDSQAGAEPAVPARAFLVDLSRFGGHLAAVRLEWRSDGNNRMTALAVETSDNLVAWTTLQSRWAIADIQYAGRRLVNDTLHLTQPTKRYLRLRQVDDGAAILPTRISGRTAPEGRQPVHAFLTLDGTPAADRPGVFLYETGGAFPIDRVDLVFDQANCVAEATLESRTDAKGPWRPRFRGQFYRIRVDNTNLTSFPQPVAVATDRHWRISVDASDSTIGSGIPRLHLGYRPHDLFFVARGRGPFTLAFGSAVVDPLAVDVAALFDGINRQHGQSVERWVRLSGKPFILGGPQRRVPPPKPLPTRLIALWSVLVGGVLVIAGMAWHLARRLKGRP